MLQVSPSPVCLRTAKSWWKARNGPQSGLRSRMPDTPAIHVQGLTKNYAQVEAVRGLNLDVNRGEIFGLIGPDGAGKTTTFQILGGLMQATSGDIRMLGRDPREARPDVGYLTQAFSLYPDLTVEE